MSAPSASARVVTVPLGERGYEVRIGGGLLAHLGGMLAGAGAPGARALAVVDRNARAHAAAGIESLRAAGLGVDAFELEATERTKTLRTLGEILVAMASARLERGHVVVAVGGGITCDVAGFAAASYRRGVPIVQCPTTLLAMVDASVGGKTGVNLEAGGTLQKNMVGAFHQPALVVADISTLATLPEREFRAGLAECVKHGLVSGCVGDEGHMGWISGALARILARDAAALIELIARSVAFKAAVVAGDERELAEDRPGRPSRAILNLGHTFAHAIETLPGLTPTGRPADVPLLHGEAVALGLVAAATASAEMGRCTGALVDEIRAVLGRCGLPVMVAGLPGTERLLALMGADKKVSGGRVRLVLPLDGRRAEVVVVPDPGAVRAGWESIRAG